MAYTRPVGLQAGAGGVSTLRAAWAARRCWGIGGVRTDRASGRKISWQKRLRPAILGRAARSSAMAAHRGLWLFQDARRHCVLQKCACRQRLHVAILRRCSPQLWQQCTFCTAAAALSGG